MVAWSTTDKTANVTLSGGNLTATFSGAGQGGVRCDTSFAGGKLYYEIYQTVSGAVAFIGWGNAAAVFSAQVGANANGIGASPGGGTVVFNGSTLGQVWTASRQATIPFTLCIAIDFTAKLFWVRIDSGQEAGGYWNNSITADPATGTGGYSLGTIAAGPYFPMFTSTGAGAALTARFGAASMWYAIPAGFSTLDTNVQNYAATNKFLSYALYNTPQAAASAFKLISEVILAPPQNAVSAYKLISYAILQPPPTNGRLDYNWPLPRVSWPKRFLDLGGSQGTFPALFPSTSAPFVTQLTDAPIRWKRAVNDNNYPQGIRGTTPHFAYLLLASL